MQTKAYLVVIYILKPSYNIINMLELLLQNIVIKAIKFKPPVGGVGLIAFCIVFQCTRECCANFKFCGSREGDLQIPDSFFDLYDRRVSDFGLCPAAGGDYILRCRYDWHFRIFSDRYPNHEQDHHQLGKF